MIEIKINFKHFKLEMLIGKSTPWFTKKEIQVEKCEEVPINAHQENNSFDEIKVEKTHISALAEKYQAELNNNAFPPKDLAPPSKALDEINKNRPGVSSLTTGSIFLHENGLYDLGDAESDKLGELFKDLPDVEVIDDDYETRMIENIKLMNQRYSTYKETHDID